MRRIAAVLVGAAARSAAADDGVSLHVERDAVHEPWLTIDPVLLSHYEGLTTESERHDTEVTIGDTRVILEGIASQNVDTPERITEDLESRSWRAAVRLTRRIGPLDFEAWAAVDGVQTRYGRGTYRDAGVALVKRFSLSRWMKAWIALSVTNRQWLGGGSPPPGEATSDTKFMLSLGTTFR